MPLREALILHSWRARCLQFCLNLPPSFLSKIPAYWTNLHGINERMRETNTRRIKLITLPGQLNSCIFCEMGFLHIGQTSREEAQSAHVPCPHKKATLRRLSRQMAHMLASSISLTCACKDSSEWRVSRYFSSFSLNSGSCPAGAPAKK